MLCQPILVTSRFIIPNYTSLQGFVPEQITCVSRGILDADSKPAFSSTPSRLSFEIQ